jgi:hypothetical protein
LGLVTHLLPDSRASRIFLAVSLVIHALLISPLPIPGLRPVSPDAPSPTAPREEMVFHFVDPQPAPEAPPEEPTPLLSSRNSRAAQPDAPTDLARGAAFQEGQTIVPTRPRPTGEPRPVGEPRPATRESSRPEPPDAEPAESAATRLESPLEPAPSVALPDPRLAMPRSPIDLGGPPPSAAGARLPAPQVDQRLSRAAAGADFSLNTTAWEYGPYMERLKARIEEQVNPPLAFYYGIAAWSTRVRFRIARDGRLTNLTLLDHRGVENLQHVALNAVTAAADYEPLPLSFPEPYLEITGSFYFNVSLRAGPSDEGGP